MTRALHNFEYGEEPTSSDMNSLPKGYSDGVRISSGGDSGITTETALTDYVIELDLVGSNRTVGFSGSVNVYYQVLADGNDVHAECRIREDSAASGRVVAYGAGVIRGDSTDEMTTIPVSGFDTNVNGAHTYYMTLKLTDGLATLSTAFSSVRPGFMRGWDEGPTS